MDAEDFMALMRRRGEPLHPDLAPFLYEAEVLGQVLKHPLVFQIPFMGDAMANWTYEEKKRVLAQSLDEGKWHTYLFLHERPYRLWALRKIEDRLDDATYWKCLAWIWTDSENIWQIQDEWERAFGVDRKGRRKGIMRGDEHAAWRRLPDVVTVWRGAQREINEDGWSYTLDRNRAEWFAKRYDWHESEPVVIEATVPRLAVIAYFRSRSEEEIVAHPDDVNIRHYYEV